MFVSCRGLDFRQGRLVATVTSGVAGSSSAISAALVVVAVVVAVGEVGFTDLGPSDRRRGNTM